MYCSPSPTADDVANGLRDLLRGRVADRITDEHFANDWRSLWRELNGGGWLDTGAVLAEESADQAQLLRDLSHIAQAWSPFLIPLPFLETIVERIPWPTGNDEDGPARPMLVTFPEYAELPLGFGAGNPDRNGFAPSLPVGEGDVACDYAQRRLRTQLAVVRVAGVVACAARVFGEVCDYSRVRAAYGHPIGSYQAVKHLLADMHVELELAQSACVWAAHEETYANDTTSDILRRCLWVLGRAIQVYGGIGFTWEAGVHFYVRHLVVTSRVIESARESAEGNQP
jgi:hypothetical protein